MFPGSALGLFRAPGALASSIPSHYGQGETDSLCAPFHLELHLTQRSLRIINSGLRITQIEV